MKLLLALTTLLVLTACDPQTNNYQFACEQVQPSALGAVYTLSQQQPDGKNIEAKELTVWRLNKRVAHQHSQPAITQAWAQDAKGGLLAWQYFDDAQRSIEYEAQHVEPAHQQSLWEEKWQVVSSALIKQMQPQKKSGDGCNSVQSYSLDSEQQKLALDWLTELQLPAKFEITQKHSKTLWTLKKLITDKNTVAQQFNQRDQWQSTDYADIGDNESDPFLLSMINLGFIDHGAEGFYNSEGKEIHRGHRH